MAVASLVLGIIGLVFSINGTFVAFFGALLGALIGLPPFFMTTIVEWFLVLLLQ